VALKRITKVPNQKVARRPKSSSSSDGLVQICVTLSQWFLHKTAAFSTEQSMIIHQHCIGGYTCCSVISLNGKLQLKHASAGDLLLKKSDINKNKKH